MAEETPARDDEDAAPPTEVTDDGPDIEELEDDPAYNPQGDEAERLKGG